ncbi:MAG: hypothetical protein AB7V48_06360 [Sedimentibacter sp.]
MKFFRNNMAFIKKLIIVVLVLIIIILLVTGRCSIFRYRMLW